MATLTSTPPESCSIAFKEWAGVCDALGAGRQSLILRKGGVSEGPGGFQPEHPAFWLYPTRVHEAEQGLRTPRAISSIPVARQTPSPQPSPTRGEGAGETPSPLVGEGASDVVPIEGLAVVEWVGRVERVEQLAALEGLHDWTGSTILGRFHYRNPGLWAMAVRVFRRGEPWPAAITAAHLGCKTWVPLDSPPPTSGLVPVLDDEESARRLDQIRSALRP